MTKTFRIVRKGAVLVCLSALAGQAIAQGVYAVIDGPRRVSAGFFDAQYAREQNRQHLGIDIPAEPGARVFAPVSGIIIANETSNSDIMKAHLIIRASSGAEQVLGHISSSLELGARVTRGQVVGTVRDWGRNSHVHWGANSGNIRAVLSSTWGWGRAPVSATKQEALSKGWIERPR
jgi:murein DD-endopeptidase MepM/ murein hydrolase activator NlpD